MKQSDILSVFASPLRLAIIASLIQKELLFSELKELTKATDGNLSVQLKKLSEYGMIQSKKKIKNDKGVTSYRLTACGLAEFEKYVALLEQALRQKQVED